MTSQLDRDSFEVENWESLFKESIEIGKKGDAIKKLRDYIWFHNFFIQTELYNYVIARMGDFFREDTEDLIKKRKERRLIRS